MPLPAPWMNSQSCSCRPTVPLRSKVTLTGVGFSEEDLQTLIDVSGICQSVPRRSSPQRLHTEEYPKAPNKADIPTRISSATVVAIAIRFFVPALTQCFIGDFIESLQL